ncbi:phosphatidylinositol-glycan biosynthesis class W protein-like [Symsagittifera roscoffensis]|uniref:phosphatidylinositol-glycan biosynthesis class W protein-like n=1 Tax=Symsagittifera roscoffensis TaxID=84072 RepID=UPI00307BCAA3
MNVSEYRDRKLEFVSNLEGTSIWVILVLTHLFSTLPFIRGFLRHQMSIQNIFLLFHFDFLFLIVPTLTFVTFAFRKLFSLAVFVHAIFIILCFCSRFKKCQTEKVLRPIIVDADSREVRFVCKSILNIVTAICILGVDFHVFPRELAKVEWHGTGLMGVGVGSFVFFNAFTTNRQDNFNMFMTTLFLMVIGIVRSLSVFLTGYHNHASEYGVHWNFFLTLSIVQIILFFGEKSIGLKKIITLVASVCLVLQYALVKWLGFFIQFMNDRSNVVLANIEGIVSLPGFLLIAAMGKVFGKLYLENFPNLKIESQVVFTGAIIAMFLCVQFCVEFFVEAVCRPTANLSYELWMAVYNLDMIWSVICNLFIVSLVASLSNCNLALIYGKCEKCFTGGRVECGCLYTAVYKNQLLFFLLANLLTGAVNLSVDTLEVDNFIAIVICLAYMYILCAVVVLKENWMTRYKFGSTNEKKS